MDPRNFHRRVQHEGATKIRRATLMKRLGIGKLQSEERSAGSSADENEGEHLLPDDMAALRLSSGIAPAESPRKRRNTVLSSHLMAAHRHVRQFYELFSSWFATGGFDFAREWLAVLLGSRECSALSEAEARRVLREQAAKVAKSATQERNLCDTNDYASLQESMIAYLSLVFLAVGEPPAPGDPPARGALRADDGPTEVPGKDPDVEQPVAVAATPVTRLRRRPAPKVSQEKLIDMNIARAICRPGSASAAVSPRDVHFRSALQQAKRVRDVRNNIIPFLALAASTAHGGGTDDASEGMVAAKGSEELETLRSVVRTRLQSTANADVAVLREGLRVRPSTAPNTPKRVPISFRPRPPSARIEGGTSVTESPRATWVVVEPRTTSGPAFTSAVSVKPPDEQRMTWCPHSDAKWVNKT